MNRTNKLIPLLVTLAIAQYLAFRLFHLPSQLETVAALGLLLAYPVMRYPLLGTYAIFIIGPFVSYVRKLYYLVYDRPEVDPLLIMTDLILILTLLGLYFDFKRERGHRFSPFFTRMVAIYFGYLCLRVVVYNGLPLPAALIQFKNYGPAVLAFFVGRYYSRQSKSLFRLWSITVVMAVIVSAYGLKQVYFGYSEAEKIWISSIQFVSLFVGKLVRPFSFFQAPAIYADYVQLGLIGALILFSRDLRRALPILFPLSGLFAYATLTTSVRSNWVGFALTLPLWFLFVGVRGLGNRLLVATVLIGGLALFEMIDRVAEESKVVNSATVRAIPVEESSQFEILVKRRSEALADPLQEYSFRSRLSLWTFLIGLANEPFLALVGRGLGTLKADSLYITYLAEFGYPGMVGIIFIICSFVIRGLQVIDRSSHPDHVLLAKGITVMNLVFAIMSITGTHIHSFPGDLYFWFWNGVLVMFPLAPELSRGNSMVELGMVA